jgi:hypothetical protein
LHQVRDLVTPEVTRAATSLRLLQQPELTDGTPSDSDMGASRIRQLAPEERETTQSRSAG